MVDVLHCTSITGGFGILLNSVSPFTTSQTFSRSAVLMLSSRVKVSPMGQSRVPAGWPLALNTVWGGAAAPKGAAVTCITEAPVTGGDPTVVEPRAAYSVEATAGRSAETSRGTASGSAPDESVLNTESARRFRGLADEGNGVAELPSPLLSR